MNTQERVLAMLNKVQKVREVKKENLGAIEDAIKNEVDRLENSAQDYIQESLKMYAFIEEFRNMQNEFISLLSSSNIDMELVYDLIRELSDASQYTDTVSQQTLTQLDDVESIIDACDQIVRGLEGINTPGLG
jgi:hypothetical protein